MIMCRDRIPVLLLLLYLNLYTKIQTKLPFTKVILTETDETNDASGIVSISFNSWLTFLRAPASSKDHLEGLASVSPAVPCN